MYPRICWLDYCIKQHHQVNHHYHINIDHRYIDHCHFYHFDLCSPFINRLRQDIRPKIHS